MKKKTNVEKIKETFAPRNKNLKPVDPKKQKGLSKLPRQVRNKMGYMKSGGRAGFMGGGASETTREKEKFQLDKNISKVKEKMKGPRLTKTQEDTLRDRSIIDKQGKRGNIVGIGTIQKAPNKVLTKRKGSR